MEIKTRTRDKEEVRAENPVPSLLKRYGIKMRGNRYMPFCHGSDQYSGRVEQNKCICYVCGKSFDCFAIVEHFEGLSKLSDQVKFLGGEEIITDDPEEKRKQRERKKAREAAKKAEEEERKRKEAEHKEYVTATKEMHLLREILKKAETFSKEWAMAYNRLQYLDYKTNEMLGAEPDRGYPEYLLAKC